MEYRTKDATKVQNKVRGFSGEEAATAFLVENGYKILCKNFTTKFGEIDIIAMKDGVVVFIEVKNRTTLAYGRPIEAVDYRKQQKIRTVAEYYLMMKKCPYADCRFDVIEMLDGRVLNHEKNAF